MLLCGLMSTESIQITVMSTVTIVAPSLAMVECCSNHDFTKFCLIQAINLASLLNKPGPNTWLTPGVSNSMKANPLEHFVSGSIGIWKPPIQTAHTLSHISQVADGDRVKNLGDPSKTGRQNLS